jgi:hypothetical protein
MESEPPDFVNGLLGDGGPPSNTGTAMGGAQRLARQYVRAGPRPFAYSRVT